ncbi:hypothetical protein [Faecalibaculum rodentium]|uniref:hypothetical protein n=1 Tax=Faecalibaculum rodentium TaxID=1702221 RepID=UPI002730CA01|nr:hypothetical protein [Faecalibaculum rodentium]
MFIEFSPTPDESSRIAVNVSALDVIELNIAEDECEVCAKTPTGVYGLYYGDRETAESRYDTIIRAIGEGCALARFDRDGKVEIWPNNMLGGR